MKLTNEEEMKIEFENNKNKYAIPKKVIEKWICRTCGRKHQYSRGYAWCKVVKEANKVLSRPIEDWDKNGTREQICKNYHWVARWNWGIITMKVSARDNNTCQDCNLKENMITETHHIIPRSKGGSDNPKNLKTLCCPCHRKYTNHFLGNKKSYDEEQRRLP